MRLVPALWTSPKAHLLSARPDDAVLFFSPDALQATVRRFQAGFPGLVTYAVKANDAVEVLENLVAAGLTAFDVASPAEMRAVRAVSPSVAMHYNNPVRSGPEIREAMALGVASYSIDGRREFEKLLAAGLTEGTEISVRLHLGVDGAAYDFGAKFGATAEECVDLLRCVKAAGMVPAMTFHPGTQCADPGAWKAYIDVCAEVARQADVRLERLNVGGGFAAHRNGEAPDLDAIFRGIERAVSVAFGADQPELVCEPGRAMVAEAFTVAARVKTIRDDGSVFLNDGIYGSFAEAPILGNVDRIQVVGGNGEARRASSTPRVVFGPTCDSLDRLPGEVMLPADLDEGDWVLFHGMGAYSRATVTRFNGYGCENIVTVRTLA